MIIENTSGWSRRGPAHRPAPGHFSAPDPQRLPEPDQPSLPRLHNPPRPSHCLCEAQTLCLAERRGAHSQPVPSYLPASVSPLVSSAQGLCSPPTQTSPGWLPGLEQICQPPQSSCLTGSREP